LNTFKIMQIGNRPEKHDTIRTAPRVVKSLDDFTDNGNKCLNRLQEQIKVRFQYNSPTQFLTVFLDPITCAMAKSLIPENMYDSALLHFKTEHHRVYNIMHRETQPEFGENNNIAQAVAPNVENDEQYNNDDLYELDLELDVTLQENNGEKSEREKADDVVELWMADTTTIDWSNYLKKRFTTFSNTTTFGKICNGDIMMWYRKVGMAKYPSIALLARTQLAQMGNQGFQERVFSSAHNAMNSKQGRMAFDVLEKRTILFHNRSLMEQHNQSKTNLRGPEGV
jgi:hypothetical protein